MSATLGCPSISVVVPVYNSEGSLSALVQQLQPVIASLNPNYELILVNDDSRDRSWDVICQLAREHPWVRGITLMRNYGQHNALLCGIRAAQHELVVTMDDDLQHPPEEIPKLIGKLAEGYDVVYGTPDKEQHGLWRDIASQITKLVLQNAMGVQAARGVSAFRAFRTHVRKAFMHYRGAFVSIDVLLTWGTARFAAIAVRHEPRRIGATNYTLHKLITHAFTMITGFSTLPLQLAILTGLSIALLGLAVLVYVIGAFLILGGSVPGFPFLASIIIIFSGAQLFTLGITGEYIARIHFRTMEKPPYIERAQTPSDGKER